MQIYEEIARKLRIHPDVMKVELHEGFVRYYHFLGSYRWWSGIDESEFWRFFQNMNNRNWRAMAEILVEPEHVKAVSDPRSITLLVMRLRNKIKYEEELRFTNLLKGE